MGFFADLAGKLKEAVRDVAPILAPWIPGVQTMLRVGIISEPRTQSPLGAVLAGGSALASSIAGSMRPPAPAAPPPRPPPPRPIPQIAPGAMPAPPAHLAALIAQIRAGTLRRPALPPASPFLPQPFAVPQPQQQLPWAGMAAGRGFGGFF